MYEPNMTLPERERLHYITNSPQHRLVLAALEGDEEQQARISELETESDGETKRADAEYDRAERAEEKAADAQQALDDLKVEADELRQQIHAAGVDLA